MDFNAAGSKVPPITQGWLGLVICLWRQSQHATKELWDHTKNFHKHMVNNPHKINCDPETNMIHDVPEDNKKSWVYDKQVVYSRNTHT